MSIVTVLLVPSVPVMATEVALDVTTVSVEEPPTAIEDGLAVNDVIVGAGPWFTVTVAVALASPVAFVAVTVYVVVCFGLTDTVPPVAGTAGADPSDPAMTRLVAFVSVMVSVLEPPGLIAVGLAVMVTVGAPGGGGAPVTVTVAVAVAGVVPAAPVAVTV